MALEDLLTRNNELLAEHNDLLKQVLAKAGAGKAAASNDGDAGKDDPKTTRTRKPKDNDAGAASGPSFDTLKKDLTAWLGEFAKESDKENPDGVHPEVTARKDALAKVFKNDKLKIGKLPEIENDAEKIGILHKWLHETAKKADKGHGIGRLAADPVSSIDEGGEDDDDGLGV